MQSPILAKYLGSGTGFWQFNYAGEAREIFSNYVIETGVLRVSGRLVGCVFFCVDAMDDAQQCNILQVISGDIDGTTHRHSSCAGFECCFFFVIFVLLRGLLYQVIEVHIELCTHVTSYIFLLRQK